MLLNMSVRFTAAAGIRVMMNWKEKLIASEEKVYNLSTCFLFK